MTNQDTLPGCGHSKGEWVTQQNVTAKKIEAEELAGLDPYRGYCGKCRQIEDNAIAATVEAIAGQMKKNAAECAKTMQRPYVSAETVELVRQDVEMWELAEKCVRGFDPARIRDTQADSEREVADAQAIAVCEARIAEAEHWGVLLAIADEYRQFKDDYRKRLATLRAELAALRAKGGTALAAPEAKCK